MQQINLYQPILRKQDRVFSLNTLLQGNLAIFALLLLIYFISVYQGHSLQQQVEKLKLERVQHSDTLTELRNKYPPKKKDMTLVETIKAKQALLEHRLLLIKELRHQNTGAGGNPGFSEQLIALARQHVKNLWFEEISVRDNKQLTLLGKTTSAKEVPLLIQRLASESSFNGTVFSSVNITRDSKDALIAFNLRTEAEEGSGKDGKR
jgi:hypothetical protein